MARAIRLSAAEARRAGLLDPDVAEMLARKEKVGPPPAKGSRSRAGGRPDMAIEIPASRPSASAAPVKRKRKVSRPAEYPGPRDVIPGQGRIELDGADRIRAAEFLFEVVPVPKERARVMRGRREKAFAYTPARTRFFDREVERVLKAVIGGHAPIEGPVRLSMHFHIAVPRSWPKWKREASLGGFVAPTGRPDMDNLEKALLDTFNGVLISDDAYVVERHAWKLYAERPAILARVERTDQFDVNVKRAALEMRRRLEMEGAHP